MVVGDGDVPRRVDLEGHRLRARLRFLFGLRRVEIPVLDPIQLDLAEEMMLDRQLKHVPWRGRVGDVEPGLRVGVRRPDVVERPAAAARHPQARILATPSPRRELTAACAGRIQRGPHRRRQRAASEAMKLDIVEQRLLRGHPQDAGRARD